MFLNLFREKDDQSNNENVKGSSPIDFSEDTDKFKKPSLEYIKTIFLNRFEKRPHKINDKFPGYFQYEFGIINMPDFFNEIINDGLLTPAPPKAILNMLKVSELQTILTENNLKKSGKKADLIQRIIENVNFLHIPIMNQGFYSLSSDGKFFLEKHEDYIKLRQHSEWQIGFWEYQNAKDNSFELLNFNKIILSLLDKKIKNIAKHRYDMRYSEYIRLNTFYVSSYQLFYEDENSLAALKALLSSVLLSVSGCENIELISYKKNNHFKNSKVMLLYRPIHISAYTATKILALRKYYTQDIAKDVYDNFIGPYNLCTFKMFCEIINEIFSTSILDISAYDATIKTLFTKKLK